MTASTAQDSTSGDPPDDSLGWSREWSSWAQPVFVATVIAFAASTMRILVVARFDPDTALAIARTVQLQNFLIGSVLSSPLYALGSIILLVGFVLSRLEPTTGDVKLDRRKRSKILLPYLWVGGTLIYFGLPLLWFLGSMVAGIVLIVLFLLVRRSAPRPMDSTRYVIRGSNLVVWLGVLVVFGLVVQPTMWVPPERVDLRGPGEIHGWVLASDSENTVVLLDNPRRVEIVQTVDVRSRRICEQPISPLMEGVVGNDFRPADDPFYTAPRFNCYSRF